MSGLDVVASLYPIIRGSHPASWTERKMWKPSSGPFLVSILKNGQVGLQNASIRCAFSRKILDTSQNPITSMPNEMRANFVFISRVVRALAFRGSPVTGIRLIGLAPPVILRGYQLTSALPRIQSEGTSGAVPSISCMVLWQFRLFKSLLCAIHSGLQPRPGITSTMPRSCS